MNKIHVVEFTSGTTAKTITGLFQWNFGQILQIKGLDLPSAVEVHFALRRSEEALRRIGVTKDGVTEVEIPDVLFKTMMTSDYDIYAYVYVSDEEYGSTTHEIIMKVKSRPMPEDIQNDFDEIMKAVKTLADGKVDKNQGTENNGKFLGVVDGYLVLVDAPSGTTDAVRYVEQELTEEQQEQARANIGAASMTEFSALSANKADKTALSQEKAERQAEIAVERERINNLAKLEPGSTTGDAELIDARVDKDGNTYDNVGEHIRQVSSRLSEEIEEQKEVPMASINPYKMNLKNYDVVINEGRYVTGYSTTTLKPTMTQNNTYDYDVIDMPIKHDNCILTVPYDSMQSVGQAFVLYTEGIQANNATPNHVNNKQVGVIEVSTDSYTVNLNRSGLNYERVAFTVPKGRRDFYFQNPDEGEVGKIVDKKISDNFIIAPVNMFYSIGAIGDSYTAGSALASDGVTWQDVTELSWIATMAKRAGIYYSNYGKGGATTKSYITDKLPSVLSGQAKDLYFICLGINDYMQNISVGAISDIKNDYTQNGKTFYGYYGSIIAQVQAHAPKSKIVLVKIWTDGTSKIPYDNAITEIASHFGLPTIDPFDDIYFNSSFYLDNMVSGHPTAMGYSCMGLAMERLFSKCVIENSAYFKFATIG